MDNKYNSENRRCNLVYIQQSKAWKSNVIWKNNCCLFGIIPKENGTLIESIDACFGLARKKAKGGNAISSRHGDLLFIDQDDVDNFVDNYPHCGRKSMDQVYCITFPLFILDFHYIILLHCEVWVLHNIFLQLTMKTKLCFFQN